MTKVELMKHVCAGFDGEFTTVELAKKLKDEHDMKLSYVGSYLAKFQQMKLIERVGCKTISKDGIYSIIWKTTPKMKEHLGIEKPLNPMDIWKEVYPEFFKQFPLPKGRIYKLEM